MSNTNNPHPVRALLLGAGLCCVATPFAHAQTNLDSSRLVIASESAAAVAPANSAGATRSSSTGYQIEWHVAGPLGLVGATALASATPLPAGPQIPLPLGPPILAAVVPDAGMAATGQPVGLLGVRFTELGAPLTAARFGSTWVWAAPLSDVTAFAIAPPGLNEHQNPLGPVGVELASLLGVDLGGARYSHLPALDQTAPAVVGGHLSVELRTPPNSFALLLAGQSFPGFAVPIDPYLGAFELAQFFMHLGDVTAVPSGLHAFAFPIVDNPNLIGITVRVQALCLFGAAGSFTNVLNVPLL